MFLSNIAYKFVMDADFAFLYAVYDMLFADFYFVDQPQKGFTVKGFNSAVLTDQACPFLHIILRCLVFIHLLF